MTCPNCGAEHSVVTRTEPGEAVRRGRMCPECRFRWTTVEQVAEVARRQAFQATLFKVMNGDG